MADSVKASIVCGLARAIEADIQRAGEALKGAQSARIHTFIATSPIHMKNKLRMSPDQVIAQAVKAVKWARSYTDNVEFSPEDAGRSEIDFLCQILEAVIDAGATTLNIPDTVGYTMPDQFGKLIRSLRERIPNSDKAIFSVHCHNDLGVATANSIAGVIAGARQIECTINGLGERAGNTSLEEVAMIIKQHKDLGLYTTIKSEKLNPISRLVSDTMRMPVQPNKAIVGSNAFSHSSGIHQDGFLKDAQTYEIMNPEEVGADSSKIVLTARSGRSALAYRFQKLGFQFDRNDIDVLYNEFVKVADSKKEVEDGDLALIAKQYQSKVAIA